MIQSYTFRNWIRGGVVIGFWQEHRVEKRMDSPRAIWLPMTHIYSVRETWCLDNPMEGTVTHGEVKYSAELPGAAKRDFDYERSAVALTFDVPAEKLSPRIPDTTSEGAPAEVTPELRAFRLSSALCNLATVRFNKK